ncbi:MAG: HAMP domain-containing sensor histidine kinase [Lutibacter sp.]|uniref:sensor histidine kinase n=1 Tax=Lutibacter sp. TaxID=1925666 RepID=UPI00385CF06A
MSENNKKLLVYVNELEEKIVDLSLQLKSKSNALNLVIESNNKSIGKLIHNLKNPVGIIFSFSDMMLEDIEDYSTEKLEKHIQIIKNSANFSLQLLTAVAKNAQLHSPKLTYNFKSVNYIDLVTEIINEFSKKASKKNCIVEKSIMKSPINLKIDKTEISLAINHVLNNALRYSNEISTIKITVKENLNTIETIVEDEGIGISKENLSAIFNDFFVVNTYSEDKKKCIGLGLPIACKIMKDHKGTISATSTLNKGSKFIISLPK